MKLALLLICLLSATLRAENFRVVETVHSQADHYCGLYCVYHAAKLRGKEISIPELLKPEYLSGIYGSSASDLIRVLTRYEVRHLPQADCSVYDLWLHSVPALALIKNSPDAPEPNHWVIILDISPSRCKIYDPSSGTLEIQTAEFQSIYSGYAILLPQQDSLLPARSGKFTFIFILFLTIGLIIKLLARLIPHSFLSLIASTFMVIIIFNCWPLGFVQNVEILKDKYHTMRPRSERDIITPHSLNQHRAKNILIIDTRTPRQYERAHIPGAINIPYTQSYFKSRKMIKELDRSWHLVLYCESTGCGWSHQLAASPLLRDFEHISILEVGIQGYREAGFACEENSGGRS